MEPAVLLERRNEKYCFPGTAMPLSRLLDELAAGESITAFCERYDLSEKKVRETLHSIGKCLAQPSFRCARIPNSQIEVKIWKPLASIMHGLVQNVPEANASTRNYRQEGETHHNPDAPQSVGWEAD